jgi:hypothetical protein
MSEYNLQDEIDYLLADDYRCLECGHSSVFHNPGPDNQWLEDCFIKNCGCEKFES